VTTSLLVAEQKEPVRQVGAAGRCWWLLAGAGSCWQLAEKGAVWEQLYKQPWLGRGCLGWLRSVLLVDITPARQRVGAGRAGGSSRGARVREAMQRAARFPEARGYKGGDLNKKSRFHQTS
jgi:hypothetical protein